jgi:hypothetical protein
MNVVGYGNQFFDRNIVLHVSLFDPQKRVGDLSFRKSAEDTMVEGHAAHTCNCDGVTIKNTRYKINLWVASANVETYRVRTDITKVQHISAY